MNKHIILVKYHSSIIDGAKNDILLYIINSDLYTSV